MGTTTGTAKKTTGGKKTAAGEPLSNRRILVRLTNGTTKIVENVPANAKITFGTIHAGNEKGWGGNQYALRIYTSEQNQLAVFVGVTEFRDLALRVLTEQTDQEELVLDHSHGDRHERRVQQVRASKYVEDGPF